MPNIEDFGQKIGGARKDVWKLTGITAGDLAEMNDMERTTHVKKDNVWIKPDWEQMIAEGTPQALAYWKNKMRQSLPPKPANNSKEAQQNYVSVVSRIRDAVMEVEDASDINRFFREFLLPNFTKPLGYNRVDIIPEASGIVTNKVLKAAQARYSTMQEEAKKKLFGVPKDQQAYVAAKQGLEIYFYDGDKVKFDQDPYNEGNIRLTISSTFGRSFYYLRFADPFYNTLDWEFDTYFVMGKDRKPLAINFSTHEEAEEFIESFAKEAQKDSKQTEAKDNEKSNSDRKKHFVPRQLAHIKYTGPHYRGVRSANSQMFLDDLKFRGGEFGNWLNNEDRQASLNMAYDALRNLAELLGVRPEDVSLNGNLAIAFGARGRGGASAGAAHYEPLRQVINLTKMSGAGCLAHEWGHALDHAIGRACGGQTFATEEDRRKVKMPESFHKVMDCIKYKEVDVSAEELRKEFDPKIEHAQKNLHNWIQFCKPAKLAPDLSKAWDDIEKQIFEKADSFTGNEYWTYSRRDPVITHPNIEELSNLCKFASGHVIPKKDKHQIALWANEIRRFHEAAAKVMPSKSYVKTQYFKDSAEFDSIYSKYGHGYWQSECEMFARAFDCYIADKVREAGYRSDYLSSNADSFIYMDGDREIAAFPRGEERAIINKAFDQLIEDLKERGILHEAPPPEIVLDNEPESKPHQEWHEAVMEPPKKMRYEQLSLDEMLFSAASRTNPGTSEKGKKSNEISR